MGFESIVYGLISGSTWSVKKGGYRKSQYKNIEVISSIPEEDNLWPPITRNMFSTPNDKPMCGVYRSQPLHFGCSLKGLEFSEISIWLDKFEKLLKKLYWFEAFANINTEVSGHYSIFWGIGESVRSH